MTRKRLSLADYTVGWLCAIEQEYLAARAMLDEKHECLPKTQPSDKNIYTYGEINNHNVVVFRLPTSRMGKVSANQAANDFNSSFPHIKIFLLVGIGGALPYDPIYKRPIYLGDVVVSSPEAQGVPAVVDYNSGKETSAGFKSTSLLDKPLSQLIAAVDEINTNELEGESSFHHNLQPLSAEALVNSKVKYRHDIWEYPGSEFDILFRSNSKHRGVADDSDPDCSKCSEGDIHRRAPPDHKPICHRGTIASGDSVIQDGETRDARSKKFHNAICFEMEAAGIMDLTHALVIRGISDYADSHKNYKWHYYAAATAAAYARQLLHVLPTTKLQNLQPRPLSIAPPCNARFKQLHNRTYHCRGSGYL